MKQLIAILITSLFFGAAGPLAAQQKAAEKPKEQPVAEKKEQDPDYNFTLGMVLWSYFNYNIQSAYTNFGIGRLYLTGKKMINDNVGVEFIMEGYLESATSASAQHRWGASIKEAFLHAGFAVNDFSMKGYVGMIETPFINYFDRVGRNLPYYDDPVQVHSIIPGNDLGIGTKLNFADTVSLYITITNGGSSSSGQRGYKFLEPTGGAFLYAARLSVTPIPEVIITGMIFYDVFDTVANSGVAFWAASVAWKDRMIRGGVNFTMEFTGGSDMIIDAWFNYNLLRETGIPLKVYLQYYAVIFGASQMNAGVGFEFAPSTDIALFYQTPFYGAGSVFLHFTTKF